MATEEKTHFSDYIFLIKLLLFFQQLTFWTLRLDKFQELIIVSLHAYLVEIAMLRLAVRLERCNAIDFIFLNAKTLL